MGSNKTIAVFAGHGGSDPGAVSGKLLEKDFNLQTANALAKHLRTMGYTVIQNRTTDVDSSINSKCVLANNSGADVVCELHLNAGGGTGTEAWYADGSGQGKKLAEKMSAGIAALGYKNRGAKNDKSSRFGSFGILRGTQATAVLAELCFLDSKDDMARFDAEKTAAAAAGVLSEFCPLPSASSSETKPADSSGLSQGDKVTITGAYASSASASSAPHSAAIGKTAVVGKIYEKSNYPYRLDSTSGVAIGFAKASSIKKQSGSATKKNSYYTVVKGDSLWSIAQKLLGNGNRYKEIKELNNLSSETLMPGQKLKIPAK